MECLCLNLSLLLKAVNHVLVTPTDLMRQTLIGPCQGGSNVKRATYFDGTIFATRLQPQHSQGRRYNHFLFPVVWGWDAFKKLEAFKSSDASGALVRRHAADSPVKNLGRSAVMKRTRFFGVDNMPLVKEIMVTELERTFRIRNSWQHSYLRTVTLFRKKLPEILISSHLTTIIFWPERICLDTIEARRPRR